MTEQEMVNELIKGEYSKRRNDLIFMFITGLATGIALLGLVLGVLYG